VDDLVDEMRGRRRRAITAVDTSVLLDVLTADRAHGRASAAALAIARQKGAILACEVVWAEAAAWFPSAVAATETPDRIGLRLDRSTTRPRRSPDNHRARLDDAAGRVNESCRTSRSSCTHSAAQITC
jgi:hypothetical protein